MLKTGTTILLIGLLFGALYSIVVIVSPQTVTNARVKAIPELQNPVVAKAYYDEARHLGADALAAVIGALFILFAGFKKGQKWAWWAVLSMGIFGWVYGLVRFIIIGDMKNLIGFAIGTALWLIGLLLPIGVFFPGKPAAAPTSQA
jgi:hypothetical protein